MLSCRDSALVIRPTRSDYYSSLTMTRSIFHDAWGVFVYAEIVNTSRNDPTVTQVDEQHLVPFIIDVSTHHDVIPDETLFTLGSAIEEVHPGSIQWVTIGGRRCFQYMKPQGSTTDVLPILQYTIHGSATIVGPIRPLTIISIFPRDYLKHVEDQHYVSRVHGIRGIEYQGIFGVPFLTQVSVVFDSGSTLPVIGFAEPI